MWEFLSSSTAQVVLWCTVLAVLLAMAAYVVTRFRGGDDQDEPAASQMLTKFEEMHSQGGLTDDEYRNIKTHLGSQLHQEIKDTGGRG